MTQTIIRSKQNRTDPFVMIDQRIAEDETLSWGAKGLMSYLLGLPDDWQIRVADLVHHSRDGKTAVRSALRELEAHGYIVRERLTDPRTGRFTGTRLTVYEQPQSQHRPPPSDDQGGPPPAEPPCAEVSHAENPDAEKPHPGNRVLLSNEDTKKEDDVDDVARPSAHAGLGTTDPLLAQVVALYEQEIGGTLTAMIHDELTDLVATQCQDLERWRAAFRASIGARNRWHYTRAIILHPERKPPKEVSPRETGTRRAHPRGNPSRRPAGARAYTLPSREEIERVNREAAARLRKLNLGAGPSAPPGL